jgi:AraC-like DNA-binding protein
MNTQISLVNIALNTGFSDQSHLTRRFKQILGVTPPTIPQFYSKLKRAIPLSSLKILKCFLLTTITIIG